MNRPIQFLASLPQRLWQDAKRSSTSFRFLLLIMGLFIGLLTWASWLRYQFALVPIVDTGEYNQAMYNTWFNGRLMYCPWEWLSPQGSFLGIHFSPLLFALLPFYAVAAAPPTLLLFQAFALGMGAVPTYQLARAQLGSDRAALGIALAYLMVPATFSGTWAGFHLECFLPWFLLSTFYELYRKRWSYFLGWFAASLCVIETIGAFLLIFAVVWVLELWLRRPFRWKLRGETERQVALAAVLLCVSWILLSDWIMAFFSPYGGFYGGDAAFAWVLLGAKTGTGVFFQALLHPSMAATALSYQSGVKEAYILVLVGSLACLPLFGSWRYLAPAAAWFALAVLSNWSAFYTLGLMYLYYPLPFLLVASIDAIPRLSALCTWVRERLRRWRGLPGKGPDLLPTVRRTAVAALLVAALASSATVGVLAPGAPSYLYFPQIGQGGWPAGSAHQQALEEVVGLVPKNAYVATTLDLLSLVSDSARAYVIPPRIPPGANNSNFNSTMGPILERDIDNATYVLIDYSDPNELLSATVLSQFANLSAFGVRAAVEGIYLYERGWVGPPQLWEPLTLSADLTSLVPGNAVLLPHGGPGGQPAIVHSGGLANGTTFWRSKQSAFPAYLAPGVYRVSLEISCHTDQAGPQLLVSMADDYPVLGVGPTVIAGQNVSNFRGNFTVEGFVTSTIGALTFSNPGNGTFSWSGNLTALVSWTSPGALFTSGWIVSGSLQAELYGIDLVEVSPLPAAV